MNTQKMADDICRILRRHAVTGMDEDMATALIDAYLETSLGSIECTLPPVRGHVSVSSEPGDGPEDSRAGGSRGELRAVPRRVV